MKKKIIALCLVIALAATAIVGGTLAYFTDTDNATNTFTVGGVSIVLNEQERQNGELVEFSQDKVLMPLVGSAQEDPKDEFGMTTAKNYVDKMVTVTNNGVSDAYVRAYFAIPTALGNGYETFNAGMNILHFNFGNKIVDGEVYTTCGDEWNWQHSGKWNYYETTIDGIAYNVYYADYTEILPAGATTERLLDGVYLDSSVDQKDGKWYAFGNEFTLGNLDMSKINCPVFAVAVQVEGFDNAADAVEAAFGANYNPFGGEATNWQ